MRFFAVVVAREWRRTGIGWTSLAYLVAVVVTFSFAVGPDLPLLRELAPAVLWAGTLLALILAGEVLFEEDGVDGSHDRLRSEGASIPSYVWACIMVRWATHGLPLAFAAAILSIGLGRSLHDALTIGLSLGLGSWPIIAIVGAASAIVLRVASRSLLLPLIALPLSVPIVVFGVSAASDGDVASFALLASSAILASLLAPLAAAAAIDRGD